MIGIKIIDAEFQEYLTEVQFQVHNMMQTLIDVSHIIEQNTEDLVPYDYNKPWGGQHLETSFFAVPTGESTRGFVELEIGYSSLDPRDGYDYAEYIHTGVDYRTGMPLNWQKATASDHFLFKGIATSEGEAYKIIESDYLSLFGMGDA